MVDARLVVALVINGAAAWFASCAATTPPEYRDPAAHVNPATERSVLRSKRGVGETVGGRKTTAGVPDNVLGEPNGDSDANVELLWVRRARSDDPRGNLVARRCVYNDASKPQERFTLSFENAAVALDVSVFEGDSVRDLVLNEPTGAVWIAQDESYGFGTGSFAYALRHRRVFRLDESSAVATWLPIRASDSPSVLWADLLAGWTGPVDAANPQQLAMEINRADALLALGRSSSALGVLARAEQQWASALRGDHDWSRCCREGLERVRAEATRQYDQLQQELRIREEESHRSRKSE